MLGALEVKRLARVAALHGVEWKTVHTAVMDCLFAHHNRRSGHCWPERKVIAAHSHVSERTVDRVISQLVKWGVIKKQRPRSLSTGEFGLRQYAFLFELPCDTQVSHGPCAKKGGHHAPKKGVTMRQSSDSCNKEEGKVLEQGKEQQQATNSGEQSFDGQVREIAALYPNVDDALHLTPGIFDAIADAIRRDGRDVVWVGTKCMAERVAHWPRSELKFLPSVKRYFGESQYRKDPEYWNRSTSLETRNQTRHERQAQEVRDVREQVRDLFRREREQTDPNGVDRRPPTGDVSGDGQAYTDAGNSEVHGRRRLGIGG
jgi:hypothetical protein